MNGGTESRAAQMQRRILGALEERRLADEKEARRLMHEALPAMLAAGDLIPAERTRLGVIKAVKVSGSEWARIEKFIELLARVPDPETREPYLEDATFAGLVRYCLNDCYRRFLKDNSNGEAAP